MARIISISMRLALGGCLVAVLLGTALGQQDATVDDLLTVAERSDFAETAKHAEVMEFCRQLAKRSARVELAEFGQSFEGRPLPLLIIADPPVKSADAASKSKKLVVFAMGNIHAGEVCGKEALLMLARELVAPGEQPLLEDLVILFAPNYNPDGNERFSRENRTRQNGPQQTGQRANAQGLDLNRDHVKLESPEARALVRLLNQWQPAIAIDCHTTNGSYHRFALTYDGPRHPATSPRIVEFARDEFLPEVSRRLRRASGYKTFFFGNFVQDHKVWDTYPADPRFSTHYFGLRNQIGILSEANAAATFRDRVLATRDFVRHCLELAADRKTHIEKLLAEARQDASRWDPEQPGQVGVRYERVPLPDRATIPGFVEERRNGKVVPTDQQQDYEVEYLGATKPTLSVTRPFAYLFPAEFRAASETLQRHGLSLELLREDIELDVELYRLQEVQRQTGEFQKHQLVRVDVTKEQRPHRFSAGSLVVRTAQPLSPLITTLLESASQDGLTTWNFFDKALAVGELFPVARLMTAEPLHTIAYNPLRKIPQEKQPITFETLYGRDRPNFSGRPVSGLRWLDDGQHYLQRKENRFYKVHAATGRNEVWYDPRDLSAALRDQLEIDEKAAQQLTAALRLNPQRTAGLIQHRNDLYHVTLDGGTISRLTDTPQPEELPAFSPDGRHVAFVRGDNLYSVNVDTAHQRQLTDDASPTVRNGKADWVYFEEIYGRNWQAYKWSPDSKRLVFQQFDDNGVDQFAVLDHLQPRQSVEMTHYPKAGRPNPRVRLGIVHRAGGPIRWADLSGYSPGDMLIAHFGWLPDSQGVYYYVQNRIQNWLDFQRLNVAEDASQKLFREETKAWVSNPGDPHFLDDGTFLLFSERDGWQHLYHFAADGKLRRRVTSGQWEVRQLHVVDQQRGWLYFSGTRDSHLARNLYRVKLDGSRLTRLTRGTGDQRASVSPTGEMYLLSRSDHRTPTRVELYSANGTLLRTVDTNPVTDIDDYRFQPLELAQIETRDGFLMEASLIKPPDFDANRKYPVWLLTYGGPHAPTLTDSWRGGRGYEQMLAQMGVIALRVDPRSASGKGACSAWQAYRQLGIQELKDLEDAVDWLTQKSYVDSKRIGMSGHSYGGFLTAFALTHSKKFSAGISGAPVTDWRNYDTIYTERYMSTPQDNPDGYQNTSVVTAGKDLHGQLLILHGARDDNVHFANTLQLVRAMQAANKQFELMVYPSNRHGIHGRHYSQLTVDFIRRTMLEQE